MSNKFNVRPAPRKRPWICKASPPALLPPTTPQPLICSFKLLWLYPPAAAVPFEGSFTLTQPTGPNRWEGTFVETINRFHIEFTIDPATQIGTAVADWDYYSIWDNGSYGPQPAGRFPLFHYQSSNVTHLYYHWSTRLLITS